MFTFMDEVDHICKNWFNYG